MRILCGAFLMLLVSFNTFAGRSLNEIKQVLNSANTATFSKENLMVARISSEDEGKWRQALAGTKEFVIENRKIVPLTTPMENYLDPVFAATNSVINTLNDVYYNCIKNAVKNNSKRDSGLNFLSNEVTSFDEQVDSSKLSKTCISTKIAKLDATRSELSNSFENLKSKTVILSSEDAREAIYLANFILRTVIDKIKRDAQKLYEAANL
ncbi:MAG: hypothetical protein KC505_00535 [Myxococcales bacterium]|nr:hypothetical protein [Myxococcales bacterium]USN51160.1 MAG: hypothetical protein H6731_01750 [Myxococcales bacterium]